MMTNNVEILFYEFKTNIIVCNSSSGFFLC